MKGQKEEELKHFSLNLQEELSRLLREGFIYEAKQGEFRSLDLGDNFYLKIGGLE